jgi:RNA polymerase sigma-70 factor, ECF subfamily
MCRRSTVTEELRGTALLALSAALAARDHKLSIQIMWQLHHDEVLRYCRRMLANDAEAADVTQKVFENAIRDLDRLRSVDSTSRWLIGIARHRCLDHARSARRDPQLVDANTLCQIAGPSFIAEPATDDARALGLLGQSLKRLDARDRALIELRFYQGLPFKEIAKQLGTTPAALRVRLTRACLLLRKYLNTGFMKGLSYESPQTVPGPPRANRRPTPPVLTHRMASVFPDSARFL